MNNKLEVCKQCTQQCVLEEGGRAIVDRNKRGSLSIEETRQRISVLSQRAHSAELNCPPSEVQQVRVMIAEQIGDRKLLQGVKSHISIGRRSQVGSTYIPGNPNNESYAQYRHRIKRFK